MARGQVEQLPEHTVESVEPRPEEQPVAAEQGISREEGGPHLCAYPWNGEYGFCAFPKSTFEGSGRLNEPRIGERGAIEIRVSAGGTSHFAQAEVEHRSSRV